MYNGIGLQTARGSGTNGYVQANMANLLLSKKRVAYNSEADIKRAEAEINKQPNKELLEHNRKRHIELKCADFEMLMENKGFDEAEIQKKVNEYRKLLQSQVASGELDIDAEMDNRDTHVRAKAAIENRGRMRAALGIKDDFVEGTSFEKLNKSANLKVDEIKEDDNKKKKKKSDEMKKSGKTRKTVSSSSSSLSSSSEESSDDSSESSSDSDNSSSDSVEESSSDSSSESNSSEISKAKIRKKVKDIPHNERNLLDKGEDSKADRERHLRRDPPNYYDRSYRHKRHNNDHVGSRRFGRSYDHNGGGRRDWCTRRYDHRDDLHRRNDAGSDRRRKHDHNEKRYHQEKEKRSHRKHHDSSDSDTDRRHKHDEADRNDKEDRKQLRQRSSSVEEKKDSRSKLRENILDTKEIKEEPALSPNSVFEESSRSTRNKTPVSQSNTGEITLPEKQIMEGVKMDIDVQKSKTKINSSDEDEVKRSSDRKRSRCHSSEIGDNSEKRYRHDTPESEDGTESNSSSNDEFLHHSDSARSSTTTSNGSAAEHIFNENSDEICSPSHSPKGTPEIKERSKRLGSRERKTHSPENKHERSNSNKSTRKHKSCKDSKDGNNYRGHGSRGSFSESLNRNLSRVESDHDNSESDKRNYCRSDNFRKYKKHYTKSSESNSRRSGSDESRHHGHHRLTSSDRIHRLSRRKSHSNDSIKRKRHDKSRSRSHSKRQVTRSRSPSRRHHKHSENQLISSHQDIHKAASVLSRKRSYSPKNSNTKRFTSTSESKKSENSKSVESSESVESTSEEEEHSKRRRHDSSTSEDDDEDTEGLNSKRSRRSSGSSSSSSNSSQSSKTRTGQKSNDYGKKRHQQHASILREPVDESD
ncbi:Cwf21 [Onchocerca flexuosa]|uniref:Cwf21 n=1 Tax=Onchocerca flexuosa TaxID=387005 RepID=A0A238BR65_9BILA|nr:Cwf21 [Onchocerca flexuosa]